MRQAKDNFHFVTKTSLLTVWLGQFFVVLITRNLGTRADKMKNKKHLTIGRVSKSKRTIVVSYFSRIIGDV